MGSITIRRIDDETKAWLRARAASAGRSVESELRHLLAQERERDRPKRFAKGMEPRPGEGVGSWMHRISRPGFDIDVRSDDVFALRDPDYDLD